jgi:pimeloyl-ACP methyl ester carboxylesterase
VPALIIWGKEDKLIPVAYAAEFQKRIANSRVEIIEASGHIPQMEQLDKTLALVKAFIAS